jgi:uncharacterized membrane protein
MQWNKLELEKLPDKDGFRLRGLEMTRLETFCDAAFAFAVTLLVISGEGIPGSYQELIRALRGIPAFAASFAVIAALWSNHRTWSRRFGLEDAVTTLISLVLVFVMLVYVYPLKMVFAAMFHWLSNGWLPSNFTMSSVRELNGLFIIYGVGFATTSGLMALLNLRGLKLGEALRLNTVERAHARQEILEQSVLAGTALVSAAFAAWMPLAIAPFAGFVYCTLPISMPLVAVLGARRIERLRQTDRD